MKKPSTPSAILFKSLLLLGLFFSSFPLPAMASGELSEEALVDLVKPGVVRIATHITGTAKIPTITVDILEKRMALTPGRFTEVSVDEYLTGSGFIIHPDGYIATNAHVISTETMKTSLSAESALTAVFENSLLLNEEEMNSFLDEKDGENFSREIVRFVMDNALFDLSEQIVVVRPFAEEASVQELMETSFPAEIVALNDNFLEDERDVALLKIAETGLPALKLGQTDEVLVGKKVYALGFPGTAEINSKDPSEATFTRGIIGALKQSSDGEFKILQTDAKVSQGSSGGPMFNEHGEVLGLITFQTDEFARTTGDNFAFALPVDIVKKQALEARVLPEEGVYGEAFRLGFSAFLEKRCTTVSELFLRAEGTNQVFETARFLEPYRTKCLLWQDQGNSRDTYWDQFRDDMETMSSPLVYLIGGGILSLGVLGATLIWLVRQLRREEREIMLLERRLLRDERELRQHEAQTKKAEARGEGKSKEKPPRYL